MTLLSRRNFIATIAATAALPRVALADNPLEIDWDDLIPPGIAYSEIIADGERDEELDFWNPIYDENATKLNPVLDGTYIKIPGYVLPLDQTAAGVTSFLLVPYVGACLHVPPPPSNQLIYVTTDTPWAEDDLWEAVWVIGRIAHGPRTTGLAEVGYTLSAQQMELYVWE